MARTTVVLAGLLLVVTASGVSACAAGATGSEAPAKADASASTEQEAAPSEPDWDTTFDEATFTYDEDAVERFGRDGVEQATAMVSDFAMDHSYDETMLRSSPGENEDAVLAMTSTMTPEVARDWTTTVENYSEGGKASERASDDIAALTLYALWSKGSDETGYVASEGPGAVNPHISKVRTLLRRDGRLQVDVQSSADVRLTVKDRPVLMGMHRTQSFYVKRTVSGWKIDGWTGWIKFGRYRPER